MTLPVGDTLSVHPWRPLLALPAMTTVGRGVCGRRKSTAATVVVVVDESGSISDGQRGGGGRLKRLGGGDNGRLDRLVRPCDRR